MKVLMRSFPNFVARARFIPRLLLLYVTLASVMAVESAAQQDTLLDQLFTMQSIRVDETARSSSRARQAALLKAEEEAYGKLLRKITQLEDRDRLPALSVQERQALISGLEFVDEQSSSRRYVATLNVRFEPSRVSEFLASYGVPHVLGTGRPILVLHAHKRGLTNFLWNVDSAIQQSRQSVDWVNRIRGYRFARGEIRERLTISAMEVHAFNLEQADVLSRFNSLESSVLISSQVSEGGSADRKLMYRYFATDSGVSGQGEIPLGDNGEVAALASMYEQILEVIDGAWRERLLVDTGSQGELEVLTPSLSLQEFAEIERRLDKVTLVQSFRVLALGLPLSKLHLLYTGREDQLALALRFEGLDLKPYGEQILLELRN